MKIWQVDSFTNTPFKGNPAGVMFLQEPLEMSLMQNISHEMNLSETAFVILRKGQIPLIRFFTPEVEVDLCGHATLAAAHIYLTNIAPLDKEIIFDTLTAGQLSVVNNQGSYTMNFPTQAAKEIMVKNIPETVLNAISDVKPIAAYEGRDLMLVYENEDIVRNAKPNYHVLNNFDKYVVITSKSSEYDYILRFFCAGDGIEEDPVTGSAQCMLGPYWANELGKNTLSVYQASARGGKMMVEVSKNRVNITGSAVTVFEGMLKL